MCQAKADILGIQKKGNTKETREVNWRHEAAQRYRCYLVERNRVAKEIKTKEMNI